MSRETDRLIADRGHGMSKPQREAIRWLATDGLDGVSPRSVSTWDALERVGLVEHRLGVREFFGYRLTQDGRDLAARRGMTRNVGRELSPEDRAECAEEARMKRKEDH